MKQQKENGSQTILGLLIERWSRQLSRKMKMFYVMLHKTKSISDQSKPVSKRYIWPKARKASPLIIISFLVLTKNYIPQPKKR